MASPSVDGLLHAARESRMAQEHGDVWVPIVVYASEKGEALGLLGATAPVPQQLIQALVQMHDVMGHADWIAFTGDTYATYLEAKDESDAMKRMRSMQGRRLAREFKEGSPDVIEVMVVMLASPKDIQTGYQSYRYTPVDGWEWDEPEYHGLLEGGGAVQNVLEAFFQAQSMAETIEGEK